MAAACLCVTGVLVLVVNSSPTRRWFVERPAAREEANLESAVRDNLVYLKNTVDVYLAWSLYTGTWSLDLPTWDRLILPEPDSDGIVTLTDTLENMHMGWLSSSETYDPWGNEYELRRGTRDYEVRSWGPDGLQDTEDDLSSKRL